MSEDQITPEDAFARQLSLTTRMSSDQARKVARAISRAPKDYGSGGLRGMFEQAQDSIDPNLKTRGFFHLDTARGDDISVAALWGVDASGAVTMQESKTLGGVVIDDSACKDPNLANVDEAFSALSWDGPSYSLHDLAVRQVINDEVERELARIARIDQPKPADHDAAIHAAMTSPPGPAKR